MNDYMNIPGSKWWKFDFHTHTPASYDYARGDEEINNNTSPEEWLKEAMKAELDCVVVTDHNTGRWIDKLKDDLQRIENEKPDWYRPLTIFPGVEINVGAINDAIHFIAIFDPKKNSDTIIGFLGSVGIQNDTGSNVEQPATEGFENIIQKIKIYNGILIPAHIFDKKGILYNRRTINPTIDQNRHYLTAIEVTDLNQITHCNDPQFKKVLEKKAQVQGSDAHFPYELGSRYTWIKMSHPTIEELRLALLDWENCVDNGEENPNITPDLYIESLSIKDMKLCGRNPEIPFEMKFSPKFNTLIGGRGSGKSTVLESIRIASRRESELNKYNRLQDDIEKFLRTDDKGLMLENSAISIIIRRMDRKFRINWNVNGSGNVVDEKIDGEWQESDEGNLLQRFPLNIYSQKQIFELASNPEGLLAIIDRSPEVNYDEWKHRWDIAVSEFMQLRERGRQFSKEIALEKELRVKLKDVQSQMEAFEKGDHANILKHYQKRNRQINSCPIDNDFNGLSLSLQQIAQQIEIEELPVQFKDDYEPIIQELTEINEEVNSSLKRIKDSIISIAQEVKELSRKRKEKLLNSKWYLDVQEAVKKYEAIVIEYEERKLQVSLEAYQKWTQDLTLINNKLKRIESLKEERKIVENSYNIKHSDLVSLRKELHQKRQCFLNIVLNQNHYVSMEIVPFGDWENIESRYREMLGLPNEVHRSSIYESKEDKPEKGLLCNLIRSLQEDSYDIKNVLKAVQKVKLDTYRVAGGESEPDLNYISKLFANKIQSIYREQPTKLDQLKCWWPKDKLIIKYSREKGKSKLLDIEKGSKGQKAAAILAFLLSYGNEPLIIDQPEDDLDNALIYELVVKQIQSNKKRRQLVIVTHNANIVVNGDTEHVNVLKMKNGLIQIDKSGGLGESDIRHSVCDILEGGKEAFYKRYERMTLGEKDV